MHSNKPRRGNMAKITPQKASSVEILKELLSRSKAVAVVDYKGLKVSQVTELRRLIRQTGGQLLVAKNTLFLIAANQPELKLEGTSAFVFSLLDEVSSIKAIADFAKKHGLPSFKSGLLSDKVLSAEEISQLAAIPGRDVLIAKTVGTLNSPIFRLVYSLNWNIGKLVRTLDAIRQSKS
ncbi:MAG: 50S ribosomal protein L10 [Candidatus Amesbacteria bacterium GW2011_GWC1_47_15]|uniref:Large ribosomal subunit protein uL10 n=5 Tax=Candidatus Amesiibacteriota TaxID=1752730 RepID=A0A0G1S0R4_9BACT|nr:MAG: 50S ribosomal protein L10 [Candidatus Amesbacteria bacterium GW2011_GWC1_47_15]KKU97414.1 MAG: 50S ribosomal protein L10 [Candidatus Amesbacteria bacterium GW2011_GWB1_48_13]